MEYITLHADQLKVVERSTRPLAVHDEQGRLRAYIDVVVNAAALAEAKRALASNQARYTTAEVIAALRARGD